MSAWKTSFGIFAFLGLTICVSFVQSETSTQTPNIIKWQDSGPSDEHDDFERRPRSLIGGEPLGLQTVQTGAVPIVSNVQTIQQVPVVSNVQTVQQVPIYSAVQQQPIGGLGGGLLGAGDAIGGIGGAGIGGGFKKYHESYTVRARGFGGLGGLGLGKFGLGGGLGGGGLGGIGAGFGGGRYKARYTKSYGGGFAGAGLLGAGGVGGVGAGGIGGGLLG